MVYCPVCNSNFECKGGAEGSMLFPYHCKTCKCDFHYKFNRKALLYVYILALFAFPTTVFIFSYILNLSDGLPYLFGTGVLLLGVALIYFKNRNELELIKSARYQKIVVRLVFIGIIILELYRLIVT
jgi:hypothetical protein